MSQPKEKSSNPLKELLSGQFLVGHRISKNWPFILFLSILGMVMIASSHNAQRKVYEISKLRNQMKELNSVQVEKRSALMKESMEYKVLERTEALGLVKTKTPPIQVNIPNNE